MLAAVKEGLARPAPPAEEHESRELDRELRPAVALVSAWVSQLGRNLEIDTTLLGTRGDIEALLRKDADARLSDRAGGPSWSASRSAGWSTARPRWPSTATASCCSRPAPASRSPDADLTRPGRSRRSLRGGG